MQTCHLPGREQTQDRCSITVRLKLGRRRRARRRRGGRRRARTRSETGTARATCAPLCNANYGLVIWRHCLRRHERRADASITRSRSPWNSERVIKGEHARERVRERARLKQCVVSASLAAQVAIADRRSVHPNEAGCAHSLSLCCSLGAALLSESESACGDDRAELPSANQFVCRRCRRRTTAQCRELKRSQDKHK